MTVLDGAHSHPTVIVIIDFKQINPMTVLRNAMRCKSKFTFRRSEFQYVRLTHGQWSVAEREADDKTDNV